MSFKSFLEKQELHEDWKSMAANLAMTGALCGSMGCNNNPNKIPNKIPSQSATASNAQEFMSGDSNYHWNSQIGRYAIDDSTGTKIFVTKNGKFVQHRNVLGQLKYKKISN